jgi:23S rRNA pseudouridine1911/1915/1917 synthase
MLRNLKYKEGGLRVNGETVTVRRVLCEGDVLELAIEDRAEDNSEKIVPRALPVKLLYRDSYITVCNKPPRMPTHPSHGHLDDTLANALAFLAQKRGEPFVFRPVNRLDGDTSGVVLTANDRLSAGRLFEEMKRGNIKKTYIAVVCGVPEPRSGIIDAPIARADTGILMRTVSESGREARTEYNTAAVASDEKYSLVILRPQTGRTHQIRVHMAYIGCPLVGDFLYGERSELIDRHALHAAKMVFAHPEDGREITVSAPLPDDIVKLCEKLIWS